MSKFDELKKLADAALLSGDMKEHETFQSKCRPSVISGLIADAAQSEQDYKDVVGTIELRDIEIERLKAEVDRQAAEIVDQKDAIGGLKWFIGEMKGKHKNLHRSLCARFGYVHDEKYWWRDEVSLEEHISKQLQEALSGQMHLTCDRDLLKAEVERLTAELYEAKEFQPIGEACLSNRDTLRESLGLKLGEHLHDHVEALRKDAERYRWLRDSSESIHQFYLSTPIWFTGVKFSKENVDNTIDAAMGKGEKA